MSKSTYKHNLTRFGGSHGLRKSLDEAGITLPCSWRRVFMCSHRNDLKELKYLRRYQGKIRRNFYKNELMKIINEINI